MEKKLLNYLLPVVIIMGGSICSDAQTQKSGKTANPAASVAEPTGKPNILLIWVI